MAGDWMKVEKVTPDKSEVFAIADKIGIDPDAAFGKCFRVWRWFDDHTQDGNAKGNAVGNAPGVTKLLVDRCAGVTGFADAMEAVGWLRSTDDGVELPNFERHNGQTSKQRALTSKRVARAKQKSNAKGNAVGNAPVTVDALPREEKRREDINTPLPPKKFVKPTIDEVDAYCQERANGIAGEEFVDHYEANGWRCGKNKTPMRDWRAAVRTWEQQRKKTKPPPASSRIAKPEELQTWNSTTGIE